MNMGEHPLKTKKLFILTCLVLLTTAGLTWAQTSITYSTQGVKYFSVEIPDSWMVNVGTETTDALPPEGETPQSRLMTTMPEDGMPLWLGMWVPGDVQNFAEAKDYLDSLNIELLTDVVATERITEKINGMDVYYVAGTGKKEKENMDFRTAFIRLTDKNIAIVIYIGPHQSTITHSDDLKQILLSIHPVQVAAGGTTK